MRTNIILKDELVAEAAKLTNISSKTDLVHEGLRALIQKHAALRLALLGRSDRRAGLTRRRRSK